MIPDEFVAKIERGQVALIGQAPGPKGDPLTPLMGRIGRRLAFMMGVGFPEEYRELFARTNLLDEYPGARDDKGDLFSVDDASDPADEIWKLMSDAGGELILLGKNVARAFGFDHAEWLIRYDLPGAVRVSVVPHPSGLNHWYNDPTNQRAAKSHLRAVARRARKAMAEPLESDSSLSEGVLKSAELFDACGRVLDEKMRPVKSRECVRLAYEYLGLEPLTGRAWEKQCEDFREVIADPRRGKAGFGYVGKPHCTAHRPSWFPDHRQAELNIDSVDMVLTEAEWKHARLEARRRVRWFRKKGRDPFTIYGHAFDGFLREECVRVWFQWRWPERVLDPDNKGRWHEPCSHDFKLVIDDETTWLIDVAHDTGGVIVKKPNADLHLLSKFDDEDEPSKVYWTGVHTGVQFASGVPAAFGRSARRLIVWLNMLDADMNYSAYLSRVAEGYKPGRKGSRTQRTRKVDPNQASLLDDEEE